MRRSFPWLGLIALLAILVPALAADESNNATTKPETNSKKPTDKLVKSGKSFIGKLVKVNADKRILTVEVTYKSPKQDPQAVQHLANLQRQLVDAQRSRNPLDRVTHTNRIQLEIERAARNLYKDQTQKIELDAPEDMKVRTMLLPLEFDEKGKPRKLTEKEKRDLKGPDTKLPGYTADFDSLKADQTVEVYPGKAPHKKTATSWPSQTFAEEKENEADNTESPRPKISMIVIRAEPQK
jgi:hypothetical protein